MAFQPKTKGDYRSRDGGKLTDATSIGKKLFCDHYNRSRHNRKACCKLRVRPIRGRRGHSGGLTSPRANHTSTSRDDDFHNCS
jgi:hypothetical protein